MLCWDIAGIMLGKEREIVELFSLFASTQDKTIKNRNIKYLNLQIRYSGTRRYRGHNTPYVKLADNFQGSKSFKLTVLLPAFKSSIYHYLGQFN